MRLLHIINTLDPASGGPAEALRGFMRQTGAEQTAAVLDNESDPWIATFPGRLICLGPGCGNYGYSRGLRNWLHEHTAKFDALVVHGIWQHHGLVVRGAAKRAGKPYFVRPAGMLDIYFKRAHPLKHLKKLAYWPIESAILRDAAAVLFTSEEEKRNAYASFDLVCRPFVVPLGVDLPPTNDQDLQDFHTQFPETRGKRILLFLGRVDPKKGVDLLVQAFAGHAREGRHLVIAGPADEGAYTRRIRDMIRDAAIENSVSFTGLLTGSLKNGAFAAAETFILPSHQENFGMAVAEALGHGLPVLLSNKVNIWREVEDDGAGLIAADTIDGTCTLLNRWYTLSEVERGGMRAAAQRCFEKRFRADNAFQRFLAAVRDVTAKSDESRIHPLQPVHA